MRKGADAALAEETTQDVMLSVWRKAAQFDRKRSTASAWIYAIARNRRIDLIRRTRPIVYDPNDPPLAPQPEPPADDILSIAERDAWIRAALANLPPPQTEVLRLAFYDGLSHSEIAETTGVPLGTVKSRLRHAFTKLRAAIAETDT